MAPSDAVERVARAIFDADVAPQYVGSFDAMPSDFRRHKLKLARAAIASMLDTKAVDEVTEAQLEAAEEAFNDWRALSIRSRLLAAHKAILAAQTKKD